MDIETLVLAKKYTDSRIDDLLGQTVLKINLADFDVDIEPLFQAGGGMANLSTDNSTALRKVLNAHDGPVSLLIEFTHSDMKAQVMATEQGTLDEFTGLTAHAPVYLLDKIYMVTLAVSLPTNLVKLTMEVV